MTEDRENATALPRLLLVDDTRVVRASASRILQDGFDVVLAENGEDAWDILVADESIQAVFTDLGMPHLDGYGLLERIRQSDEERISSLPVIIVTGQEGDEARADALRRGATDFISKPFNKVDLTARAKSHTGYTRKTRELAENTTLDPVTRLGNKRQFLDSLARDRALTLRHRQDFSVLYLEVQNIRDIARADGKETALHWLKQIGRVIRTAIREEDTAARIDTARFAVSLPACDTAGLEALSTRLEKVLLAHDRRQQGKGQQLEIAIAGATPSDARDGKLADVLARLEKQVSTAPRKGIQRLGATAKPKAGPDAAGPRSDAKGPDAKGSAAKGPDARPATDPPPALDQALDWIGRGEGKRVQPHLPALLKRILPLLRLATENQRRKLVEFLQK